MYYVTIYFKKHCSYKPPQSLEVHVVDVVASKQSSVEDWSQDVANFVNFSFRFHLLAVRVGTSISLLSKYSFFTRLTGAREIKMCLIQCIYTFYASIKSLLHIV